MTANPASPEPADAPESVTTTSKVEALNITPADDSKAITVSTLPQSAAAKAPNDRMTRWWSLPVLKDVVGNFAQGLGRGAVEVLAEHGPGLINWFTDMAS